MTNRTIRQSTSPESSSSPQNKETTKSIMDEIRRLKSEIISKKELENVVQNIVKSAVSKILDVKMNVINESMKENKQFLQKVIDDQNETIEKLTKRVEDLEAELDETKHFAREAYLTANRNEQYSRKNTFKINGVPQKDRENVTEVALNVIES